MCMPAVGLAKPAYPGVIGVTNPDGTTAQVRLFGDEFFSIMTDAEGKGLLEYDSKGFVVPKMRNGKQLMNTEATRNMLRIEEYNLNEVKALRDAGAGPQKAYLAEDARSLFPTVGEARSLVVLVEFQDIKFVTEDPQKEFTRMLNEKNYNLYDHPGSARDFYEDCSNGKFKPTFDVTRVVTLPMSSAYYCGSNGKYANFPNGIRDAVTELNDEIDYTQYDADGDGTVDLVYIIYAGYGQADTSIPGTIWPHQGSLGFNGPTLDGKKIASYACSSELRGMRHVQLKDNCLDGIGSFVHEYGHALGLPDLYDPQYNPEATTPGIFSTMDAGTYNGDGACPPLYTSYEKWCLRWVEYENMFPSNEYTIKALGPDNDKAYRFTAYGPFAEKYFDNEYYVFESRSKNNRWDYAMGSEGLLIWHVDYDKAAWMNNAVNSQVGRPRCITMPPTGDYSQPMFPGRANRRWISPDEKFFIVNNDYNEAMSVSISNISFDSATGTAKIGYETIKKAPEFITEVTEATKYSDGSRAFTIKWKKPEANDLNYLITAQYENSLGQRQYLTLNGVTYNKYYIGNPEYFQFEGLSRTIMNGKIIITVTPFNGIPGTPSEEYEFTPADLQPGMNSGIEGIEDDAADFAIAAGNGTIFAPAGAEVYNMSGVRTGTENLAAGMYIVRYGSKVKKVMVR